MSRMFLGLMLALTAQTALAQGGATLDEKDAALEKAIRVETNERKETDAVIIKRLDALEAAKPPQPPPSTDVFPNTKDGKPITQIGPWEAAWYDYSDPFLDKMKSNSAAVNDWALIETSGRQVPWTELGKAGADLFDPYTLYPKTMDKYARILVGVFRQQSDAYPQAYAGTWVVDWQGDADVEASWCPASAVRKTDKRIEIDISAPGRCAVFVTRVGASGIQSIRAYRKSDEQRLNAGAVFTDQFVKHIGAYKIVRTMDWQQANGMPTRLTAQQVTTRAARWGGGFALWGQTNHAQFGMPLDVQFQLAREADVALWVNVPPLLGAVPESYVWWDPTVPESEKAAKFSAVGRTTYKTQLASPEWEKYADAIVGAAVAQKYPLNKTVYVELGNEIWNFANPFHIGTGYYGAIGEGMTGVVYQHRYAYGYFSARLAQAIDAALTKAGRADQSWTLVLAGQNAGPRSTEDALRGYTDYLAQAGMSVDKFKRVAAVSVTSYYQDGFAPTAAFAQLGYTVDNADYRAALLTFIRRDPKAAAKTLADWVIGAPPGAGMSIPNMIAAQEAHVAIAQKHGVKFLGDYEGGDHELGIPEWNRDPAYVAMMKEFRYGEQGKRVTKAWIAALRTRGDDKVISNYHGIGPNPDYQELTLPWVDCYYDKPCGRDEALQRVLRVKQ